MSPEMSLDNLFSPSSIAIVGVSRIESKVGSLFLRSLLEGGFTGKLYPVHPTLDTLMGLECYPDIGSIPGKVDLVIIATPSNTVPGVIEDCMKNGCRMALVGGVGFRESGEGGRALEEGVVLSARRGGLRITGPNTMGLFCPGTRMNTLMPVLRPGFQEGPASFVGQSGWVSENFVLLSYERGLGIGKVVDSGNEADLTAIEYIEYLADDPATGVIGAYVEGVRDGQDFMDRLTRAAMKKPVVICKGGKTEAGARAATSHTGSLAGDFAIFSAALKQAGAVAAAGVEELVDSVLALTSPQLPAGNRVGVIGDSGALGMFAVDECVKQGLSVPRLPGDVREGLKGLLSGLLPSVAALDNPVDLIMPPYDGSGIPACNASMRLMSGCIDAFLVASYHLTSFATDEVFLEFLAGLKEVRDETGKPIVLVPGYITGCLERLSRCTREGLPWFPTAERAVRAIAAMFQYSRSRDSHAANQDG